MIEARLEGLDVVISGLDQYGVDVQEAAYYAVVEALKKAYQACATLLTATDHSLRELALMGHPYGFRHPAQIHDPDVVVHVRSGAYARGLNATPPTGIHGIVFDGTIVNLDRKDRWIQEGTTKMRARPWMKYVIEHYGQDLADLIEARINAAIRSRSDRWK